MVKPETEKTEYKPSVQDEYYEWISGYAKDAYGQAGAPLPEIKVTQGSVTMVVRGSEHYMELLKNNLGMQATTHAGTQDSNISLDVSSHS